LATFVRPTRKADETSFSIELPAWRSSGEQFLARLWVASCETGPDPVIAVALADVSEQVRDAEISGLENLIAGSRVVLGAVSHEIRNLAAAISMEVRNLSRSGVAGTVDTFNTLLTLSAGLEKLSVSQLQTVHPRFDARANLARLLTEIAVIMGPAFSDCGAALCIEPPDAGLWVRADYHGLLQALLNLLSNALRQCAGEEQGAECRVRVLQTGECVQIRMTNPGEPVGHPERLFHPFEADAHGTGLGLYISRSVLRSFGGDLRYDTGSGEPCFVVELVACKAPTI
jgi:C4-dicarboxylate-specific signal transduction histidine kinase